MEIKHRILRSEHGTVPRTYEGFADIYWPVLHELGLMIDPYCWPDEENPQRPYLYKEAVPSYFEESIHSKGVFVHPDVNKAYLYNEKRTLKEATPIIQNVLKQKEKHYARKT